MYAEERQDRVERLVTATGRVAVVDLAREFDVTSETVRRDLAQLETRGVLRRVHGGAVAASLTSRLEESVPSRLSRNADAKERIAVAAMTLIPASFSGAIAIDAGTTTGRLAEHIARWSPEAPHQSLVVITNSVRIALTVAENPDIEVNLLGGRLRGITSAAVGSTTIAQLARLRPDIAFIGANGVHAEFGLSTPDEEESAVKTAFTLGARRAVALVDATKLGEETLVRFAGLADLDMLITNDSPAPDLSAALDDAGVEVMVA
ncbi:DeoR family fructose operon transcriptional repressor [Marisediminicola sp. UYEF4]|uniref:DeoR/GlpR family DNA-binding transcription regulator n=1 Tax=Marisediminicola sp. UYEF4 TaxID=1756384 RepID=UPI0033953A83